MRFQQRKQLLSTEWSSWLNEILKVSKPQKQFFLKLQWAMELSRKIAWPLKGIVALPLLKNLGYIVDDINFPLFSFSWVVGGIFCLLRVRVLHVATAGNWSVIVNLGKWEGVLHARVRSKLVFGVPPSSCKCVSNLKTDTLISIIYVCRCMII